nr:accessory gene regulator B family protein [Proteiniclasticum aestuarii]
MDQEKRSVIAYGLIGILQVTSLFLMITVIGLMTGTLYESLIIFFSVGYIRKSTGGAHSRTMWGCNTVSVASITLLAILSRYLFGIPLDVYVNAGITMAVFLAGFIIFHKRVPVDSPNKPIVSSEKIRRLRRESFGKLCLFLLLTGAAIALAESSERLYSIASSIRMAMVWQAITLTETGGSLLARVDRAINSVL